MFSSFGEVSSLLKQIVSEGYEEDGGALEESDENVVDYLQRTLDESDGRGKEEGG
jgi:hypothetical protein